MIRNTRSFGEKVISLSHSCEYKIEKTFGLAGRRYLERGILGRVKDLSYYQNKFSKMKGEIKIRENPEDAIFDFLRKRMKYKGGVYFPTHTLEKGRGNCLAQTSLFLALASELDENFSLYGVEYSRPSSLLDILPGVPPPRHTAPIKIINEENYKVMDTTTDEVEIRSKKSIEKPWYSNLYSEVHPPHYVLNSIVEKAESIVTTLLFFSIERSKKYSNLSREKKEELVRKYARRILDIPDIQGKKLAR